MPKRLIVWLPCFGIMSLLGACGSDGVGSSAATVQESIDLCQDELASCAKPTEECEADAMDCMNAVRGNGVHEEEIAEHCDALYELCSTKTDDLMFCEELRQACFDCVHRYDEDEDDDSDSDSDTDTDGDEDSDSDSDDDEDRCDRHEDDDHDDYDDDYDDHDDEDSDCDEGGTGGMAGTGGITGAGGSAGTGGMVGSGGTGGVAGAGGSAGAGGMAGAGGAAGSGGMAGTGGTAGMAGAGGATMGVSFALDIQPYFEAGEADCVRCHSGGGPAGVDLDSYAAILAGGDGFPLVVPGDSSDPSAALIPQLEANHFNGPDDAGFVVTLAQWIDEGALDN